MSECSSYRCMNIHVRLFSAGAFAVRIFSSLLAVYIFMLVLLPSGSILGFNVKIVWFCLLLPLALYVYFGRYRATPHRTMLLLLIPVALLSWSLLAQENGFEPASSFAQFKDLIVTISTCWFATLLCEEGYGETVFLLRTLVQAEVAASLMKLSLLAYAVLHGIPVTQIAQWIKNVFGVDLMTFDFASIFGRIQFHSDELIPICIFALLCFRQRLGIRAFPAIGMLLLLLISDFFAFSRYLWLFTVLAAALGLLIGKKDRFQLMLIGSVITVALACFPSIVSVVTLRFSSSVVDSSDQDRTQQVPALQEFWASAPFLGHGLGSYTRRVIRSDDAPYSYELQLLALAGQIGVIGMAAFAALGFYYFRGLWQLKRIGALHSVGLSLLLLVWIGSGLVNPVVISSAASVSYAAIFAMIQILQAPTPLSESAMLTAR